MRLVEYKSEKSEYGRFPFSAQPYPWLVICHGIDTQKQTFFSISEDRYYVRTILELRNKRICAYAHEWLVLLDYDSGDYYFWNPTSEDKIQLPPLPNIGLDCLLSAPPHDPECCVVFLTNESRTYVKPPTLYFCKPGYSQEFYKQEMPQINGDSYFFLSLTVFKGKFYGFTNVRSILLCLDLDNDLGVATITPIVIQSPYKGFPDIPSIGKYLIQSSCDENDMLLYVHKFYHGRHLKEVFGFLVFQFDFVENEWVKVKSIGETAIFLNDSTGTTCSTRGTNIERESIYLIEGRRLYVFNLGTQNISVSLPCPHVSKQYSEFHWLTLFPMQQGVCKKT